MSTESQKPSSKPVAGATPADIWNAMCKAARLDAKDRAALKRFLAAQEVRR